MLGVAEGTMQRVKVAATGAGLCAVVLAGAGVAGAVSTGGYSPAQQGCSPNADANTTQGAEPGCHNLVANVNDGSGHTYVSAGTYQTAQNQAVHSGDVMVYPNGDPTGPALGANFDSNGSPAVTPTVRPGTPSPAAASLLTGGQVYFGADDNLDFGEHDGADGQYGTSKSINGPSDGGNLVVNWQPGAATTWMADLQALMGGNPTPVAQNPVPVANAGGGGCADGTCVGVYTAQTSIYQGGGGGGQSRNAYNYQGKTWDPYACNSGSPQSEQACQTQGGHSMDWYRQQEAKNVYAEPGVQVYEDPDPQASPAGPTQAYPLPSAYAGTCGVAAGGGAAKAPASPVTNRAGQVVVSPAHC
jgi:hypothetical protein